MCLYKAGMDIMKYIIKEFLILIITLQSLIFNNSVFGTIKYKSITEFEP